MATVGEIKAELKLDAKQWKQNIEQSKKDAKDLADEIRNQKKVLQDLQKTYKDVTKDAVQSARDIEREQTRTAKAAEKEAKQAAQQMKHLNHEVMDAKMKFMDFGMAAAAGLAVVTIAARTLTREYAALNQELANLRSNSLTPLSPTQVQQAKNAAEAFGPEYGMKPAAGAEAMNEFVKAGYDLTRLANGELKDALALITQGELAAGDAAALAADSLTIYKEEALSLKQIADTTVGAANASSTSVKEMSDANRQLGGVAKDLGVSFRDVNTEFALMAKNGLRGSDGATSMKTALIQLAAPSKEAKRVMEDVGLQFFDATGKLKSFGEISDMLREKLAKYNKQSQELILSTIAGTDGIRFLSALMNQTSDDFRQMSEDLSQVDANQAAKTRLDSLSGSFKILQAETSMAAGKFVESFAPALRGAADGLTGLIKDYQELSPEMKNLITTTTVVGTTMTGTLVTLTLFRLGWNLLAKSITAAGGAMTLIARHPIMLALTALVGVASAVYMAYQQNAEAARKFAEAQDNLNRSIADASKTRDASKFEEYQKQSQELEQLTQRYEELKRKQAEINAAGVTPGKYSLAALFNDNAKAAQDLGKELAEVEQKMKDLGATTSDYKQQSDQLRNSINSNTSMLFEQKNAEIQDVAAKQEKIVRIEELYQRYNQLNAMQSLNAEQTAELASITGQLSQEYPSLIVLMDETGRKHIENVELIDERIAAEKSLVDAQAKGINQYLDNLKIMNDEQAKSIKQQIDNLMALADAYEAFTARTYTDGPTSGDEFGVESQASKNAYRRSQELRGDAAKLANEYNQYVVNKGRIADAKSRISGGSNISTGASGSGGASYSIPDAPKKGKTDEQLAKEADQAMMQRFQRELDMERHRYATGEINAGQYSERLKQIRNDYYDWLQGHESELYSLEEEAARLSFQHSAEWIANERRMMEESGRSEIEILEMEQAAWERVSGRKIYLIEDQKRAQEELRRTQQALVSEMETQLRRARELESQQAIADAESRYKREEEAIQAKINALNKEADATSRLLEYERERAKLSDLQNQRDAVAADKRFELIERDAQGNLVKRLVADLPKLAEIDKQIADQKTRISDMQREDETNRRREALEKELRDTQDVNQRKLEALRTYWNAMLEQEKITQDIRDSIVKNGMDNTMKMVDAYIAAMLEKYKAAQNQMMGSFSPAAGSMGPGLSNVGNNATTAPSGMTASEIAEYNHNKDEYTRAEQTLSGEEKQRVQEAASKRNEELRQKYGFTDDGKKLLPKFHEGVDKVPGPIGTDVPSTLQAGERVLSIRQNSIFENFMQTFMSSLRMPAFFPSFAPAGASGGGGQTVQIQKVELTVQTDSGEKVMRELEREIWKMKA